MRWFGVWFIDMTTGLGDSDYVQARTAEEAMRLVRKQNRHTDIYIQLVEEA